MDANAAALYARIASLKADIKRARAANNHQRALELLFEQREILSKESARSAEDAAVMAVPIGAIDKQLNDVRAAMRASDSMKVETSVGVKDVDGGTRAASTAVGTTTTTTTAKVDTARPRDFQAVDDTLKKRSKHDWGQAPAPLEDDAEDDLEILDELNVDLNAYMPQPAKQAGVMKPFHAPGVVRDVKGKRDEAKKAQSGRSPKGKRGPTSRWSADAEGDVPKQAPARFMSAGERLDLEQAAKGLPPTHAQYRDAKESNPTRTYGRGGRGGGTGFVPPYGGGGGGNGGGGNGQRVKPGQSGGESDDQPFSEQVMQKLSPNGEPIAEDILKLDRDIVERVVSEILDKHESVDWDSIAGLEHAKGAVQELAVWPMMNPELFVGARAVPKGLLLFGPPGTGKTLIGRAVASQCGATFFSISASSLTSKWIGEGEKMVRALFAVARHLAPAVIFVDEIDSLLSARKSDGEHESSRRMKTEFLVQMDGLGGGENDRLLLIGATNRPQELDDGARRRMPKQLYIPLPCAAARRDMILRTLSAGKGVAHNLSDSDLDMICEKTDGYSGSDMKHLIQEAARAPVRETFQKTKDIPGPVSPSTLRPIVLADIRRAAKQVRPSVTRADVEFHEEWNKNHGALTATSIDDDDDESWD